ncbi:MAG TPA: chloride channel protein [Rhodocyclaceae bacterium]|nr:chloride channel protein [Rhodocyclaceae bacterium]
MSVHHSRQRDFTADRRLPMLCAVAAGIGVCSTFAAWLLLALIHFFTNLFFFQTLSLADRSPAQHVLGAIVILIPIVGGLIVGLIARFGSDKIRGHGIPEAIEAILYRKSMLSPKVALLKPLASGIAIGSGGPFGAEGPIIMTGGAVGSLIAQYLSLSAGERKSLLVAGAVAGMTAVFGTPLAAVLLAVELLLFEWRPRSLLPAIVACTVAGFVRPLLIASGPMFPLQTAAITLSMLPICVLCGLLAGLAAALMSSLLYRTEDLFAQLPVHWMWWPAIGGLIVGLGGWLEPRALGVGYSVIDAFLNNRFVLDSVISIVIAKAIIWVFALASGTSGGVLAPLLMMGAGLGAIVAHFVPEVAGLPPMWPLICMAAMLAAALGVPLTATVFAIELTGNFNALLPLLLACGLAHGLTVLLMRRSIMTERIARRGLHVHREYSIDPHEQTPVADVMNVPICIPGQLTLSAVTAEFFGREQHHRRYPVVNDDGRLLGIIDEAFLQQAKGHETIARSAEQSLSDLFSAADADVFALPHETCQSAIRRMAVQDRKCLPVVRAANDRTVIGFLSAADLIKPAHAGFHEEHVRERVWGLGKMALKRSE